MDSSTRRRQGRALTSTFEELDVHQTWLGELVLRRRSPTTPGGPSILEVTLDDQFLMSGDVNGSEIALADLAMAAARGGALDVVVGGLGLGCTAVAALASPKLRSMLVVECLGEVISWHERDLVPLGEQLVNDERCRFVHGDFFAMAGPAGEGFDDQSPGRRFHAILMDIDHSPRGLLHGSHQEFYEASGLRQLASHLNPGGVFALWSADPTEPEFVAALSEVFADVQVHEIPFHNTSVDCDELNSVYVATTASAVA